MILLGTGMGLSTAPATEAILGVVRPEQAGIGSAVNDATRLVGGTLGVAVLGSAYASLYRTQLDQAAAPAAARDVAKASYSASRLEPPTYPPTAPSTCSATPTAASSTACTPTTPSPPPSARSAPSSCWPSCPPTPNPRTPSPTPVTGWTRHRLHAPPVSPRPSPRHRWSTRPEEGRVRPICGGRSVVDPVRSCLGEWPDRHNRHRCVSGRGGTVDRRRGSDPPSSRTVDRRTSVGRGKPSPTRIGPTQNRTGRRRGDLTSPSASDRWAARRGGPASLEDASPAARRRWRAARPCRPVPRARHGERRWRPRPLPRWVRRSRRVAGCVPGGCGAPRSGRGRSGRRQVQVSCGEPVGGLDQRGQRYRRRVVPRSPPARGRCLNARPCGSIGGGIPSHRSISAGSSRGRGIDTGAVTCRPVGFRGLPR